MYENVSCVVLGANGFIGTNLIKGLGAAGALVRGFSRNEPNVFIKDIPWVSGNFNNKKDISSAIKGCEVVYHLISDSIPALLNDKEPSVLMANVNDTLNLLEACRIEGVRKIVFVSSGGTVYGISKSFPIKESAPTDPICSYGINKLAIEKYLHLYHHLYNLDYAVVRLSNPYGPHQNTKKPQGIIGKMISNVIKGEPTEIWGDGEIIRDYIYVNDVADALIKLANYTGPEKVFNLASGVGHSINQVISELEKLIGKEEVKIIYKDNYRSIDVPVNILNVDLIKSQIDWDPKIDLSHGLKLTYEWLAKSEMSNKYGAERE
jgi:UDP-glucose 4-epimerase